MGYDTAYPNRVSYKVTGANEAEVVAAFSIDARARSGHIFSYGVFGYWGEVRLYLTSATEGAVVAGWWEPDAF